MLDWVRALNWRPQREDEGLRVSLPNIGGSQFSQAVLTPQDAAKLKRLVDAWLKADRNVNNLSAKDRQEAQLDKPVEAHWGTTPNGHLVPAWLDDTSKPYFDLAAGLFRRIAGDAEGWRLKEPCRECGKYFLGETRHPREFCTKECRRHESRPRMQAIRKQQHNALLGIIREAVAQWDQSRKRGDWKEWTAQTVNDHIAGMSEKKRKRLGLDSITAKLLTRWSNRGEFKAPITGKQTLGRRHHAKAKAS